MNTDDKKGSVMKIGIDYASPDGDYSTVAVANGNKIETIRYDVLMSYKWYKTPIKWWQYRKVIKHIKEQL